LFTYAKIEYVSVAYKRIFQKIEYVRYVSSSLDADHRKLFFKQSVKAFSEISRTHSLTCGERGKMAGEWPVKMMVPRAIVCKFGYIIALSLLVF